jgi:hypothetical protein
LKKNELGAPSKEYAIYTFHLGISTADVWVFLCALEKRESGTRAMVPFKEKGISNGIYRKYIQEGAFEGLCRG